MGIFRGWVGAASVALVLSGAACGGRRGAAASGDDPAPLASVTLPLSAIFLLEAAGTPPNDTVMSFPVGQRRTILLRDGPPDNTVFAEVHFPADAFGDTAGTVEIRLRPRPGIFGVDLESSRPFAKPVRLTFKYARHFSAPIEARRRYGSDGAFERTLSIGRLQPDGNVTFMLSTRPASDNLETLVPEPGSFVAGAPR